MLQEEDQRKPGRPGRINHGKTKKFLYLEKYEDNKTATDNQIKALKSDVRVLQLIVLIVGIVAIAWSIYHY